MWLFFFSQRDGTIEMNTITLFNTEKTLFKLGIPWNETTTGKYQILEHHNYKITTLAKLKLMQQSS